jgi:hypothetical protein
MFGIVTLVRPVQL